MDQQDEKNTYIFVYWRHGEGTSLKILRFATKLWPRAVQQINFDNNNLSGFFVLFSRPTFRVAIIVSTGIPSSSSSVNAGEKNTQCENRTPAPKPQPLRGADSIAAAAAAAAAASTVIVALPFFIAFHRRICLAAVFVAVTTHLEAEEVLLLVIGISWIETNVH